MKRNSTHLLIFLLALVAWDLVPLNTFAQFTVEIDIEEAPFNYTDSPGNNRVSRIIESINRDELKLEYMEPRGYLDSLLAALDIPVKLPCEAKTRSKS